MIHTTCHHNEGDMKSFEEWLSLKTPVRRGEKAKRCNGKPVFCPCQLSDPKERFAYEAWIDSNVMAD